MRPRLILAGVAFFPHRSDWPGKRMGRRLMGRVCLRQVMGRQSRGGGLRIMEAKQQRQDNTIGWIFLAVIVIAIAYACSGSNTEQATPPPPCSGAQTAAENFVRARLKAPSTARFNPLLEGRVSVLSNGKCLVEGWVDAQNSFGAMLRTPWRIIMIDVGDRFRLDVLQIGDQLYSP